MLQYICADAHIKCHTLSFLSFLPKKENSVLFASFFFTSSGPQARWQQTDRQSVSHKIELSPPWSRCDPLSNGFKSPEWSRVLRPQCVGGPTIVQHESKHSALQIMGENARTKETLIQKHCIGPSLLPFNLAALSQLFPTTTTRLLLDLHISGNISRTQHGYSTLYEFFKGNG